MRLLLHREAGVLQKFEILDVVRVFQVDQNTDPLPGLGFEGLLNQAAQAEGREGSVTHDF
jgi:hypothetical protein